MSNLNSQTLKLPALGLLSLATVYITVKYFRPPISFRRPEKKIIPSPRETLLPWLTSGEEKAELAYPPDLIPGARDVTTPYGSIRVYEWGPESGKKVLMVHGDATSSPIFYPIADALVKAGCRVILLDLWGRGYSDVPDPSSDPQDITLFNLALLFAITSSPIPWTGAGNNFSILGFSLGGAIAVAFTRLFPKLINSIVLLAPAGIIRDVPDEYKSPVLHHPNRFPHWYVHRFVGRFFGVDSRTNKPISATDPSNAEKKASAGATEKGGLPDQPPQSLQQGHGDNDPPSADSNTPIDRINTANIQREQFIHHEGFLPAFLSTVQNGPIMHMDNDWRAVFGGIVAAGNKLDKLYDHPHAVEEAMAGMTKAQARSSPLYDGKVLLIFGDEDFVIKQSDVVPSLLDLMGYPADARNAANSAAGMNPDGDRGVYADGHVVVKTVTGGHEFPVPRWREVAGYVAEFWGLKADSLSP